MPIGIYLGQQDARPGLNNKPIEFKKPIKHSRKFPRKVVFNMGARTKGVSNTVKPTVVREYEIKGTRYIVTATVRDGVSQDAKSIIRRLIQRDLQGKS